MNFLSYPKLSVPVLLFLALLATGCKVGTDYQRPAVQVPQAWLGHSEAPDSIANTAWWSFYKDPQLTNLIALALESNKDIRIATARMEQASANASAQRSTLIPSLNGTGGWTRGRSGYTGTTQNQFDLLGVLSYEVDIWGRLRRLNEAARAEYLASAEVRRMVYLNLVASVATSWFNLCALDEQLEIARRTYQSRTNSLQLTHYKFNQGNGIVSELDVKQAETQVYSALASIAELERGIAVTENDLNFLLGRNPQPIARSRFEDKAILLTIPAGLPSDLLFRRPDILASEQQLIAANANIGAARAAYFPTISLTAALGLQSLELDDLFDAGTSKAWSFAPQLTAPIFSAGRIRAGVRFAEARREELLANYQRSIQDAFREVENELVSIAKIKEQIAAEDAYLSAERRRLELSRDRYENGIASYLEVLDAERSLFSIEIDAVRTRAELLGAMSRLYRALGGGWTDQPHQQN